jgi:tRNA (guanine-N(7)-)-methyltransferase
VEWGRPYCQYAAQRVQRAGLANVRLIRADAAVLVGNMPPCSLTRVHIYFPDPWPKARHHHRRLLGTPMLRQLWRVLKPGGLLLIVTDHLGYFEHVRRAMAALRGWAHTAFPAMSDKSGQIVGTNFERKYIAQGRAFYKLSRMKYSR